MASNYEYECMRADLLGLPKPKQADFERLQERTSHESESLENGAEQMGRVAGGLDELNKTLDSTKKRLTRLQNFRHSFGRIFHHKPKTRCGTEFSGVSNSEENLPFKTSVPQQSSNDPNVYRSSLNFEEYARQNDKLECLINKAERAELSLNRNNKLIKKITKK
ncbi:Hypothetical protein NTJ_03505 [Nesidiocoris tenuis]|uniref:t-SNARE coiled-coil homology domain-containing protein n=1 Tax=Nesidiocoris tenuis TaxID=355587 RepID=A0ABN7AK15_9HEMI|nr:Hypothetical protein NTJ_03505 [Nesidiocoris tenuis]